MDEKSRSGRATFIGLLTIGLILLGLELEARYKTGVCIDFCAEAGYADASYSPGGRYNPQVCKCAAPEDPTQGAVFEGWPR